MSLNDHYYYDILCEFIDPKERVICSRRDRHHLVDKMLDRRLLMASIFVHLGTPCDRFCICSFFTNIDFLCAYDNYQKNDI